MESNNTNSIVPLGINIAAVSGPLFIGYLLHWGLFGTLTVQLYLYYLAFPRDKRILKAIVYSLYILELVQTILITYDGFDSYGSGFGNYEALTHMGLLWLTVPVMSGIVSCVGQLFFTYRVWILSGSRKLPIIISILAFMSSAGGFMVGYYVKKTGRIDHLTNLPTTIADIIWCGGAAFCDVFIAVCMTFYLLRKSNESRLDKTKLLVSKFIRLTIETGTATATLVTINFILYMVFPNQTFYTTPVILIPKAYANTILVILNSRFRIVGGRDAEDPGIVANGSVSRFAHTLTSVEDWTRPSQWDFEPIEVPKKDLEIAMMPPSSISGSKH